MKGMCCRRQSSPPRSILRPEICVLHQFIFSITAGQLESNNPAQKPDPDLYLNPIPYDMVCLVSIIFMPRTEPTIPHGSSCFLAGKPEPSVENPLTIFEKGGSFCETPSIYIPSPRSKNQRINPVGKVLGYLGVRSFRLGL